MHMRMYFQVLLFQIICSAVFGQARTLPLLIDVGGSTELLITFEESTPHTDTIAVIEGYYSVCTLEDSRGAMSVKTYTTNHVLIREGRYVNSIDTFKSCVVVEDPYNPGTRQVIVERYFHPLKNGLWRYYNVKGKVIREERWSQGILEETILFGKLAKKKLRNERRANRRGKRHGVKSE